MTFWANNTAAAVDENITVREISESDSNASLSNRKFVMMLKKSVTTYIIDNIDQVETPDDLARLYSEGAENVQFITE